MDPAYNLEQALKTFSKLSDTEREKILENSAGTWERSLGQNTCKKLAKLLNELMEDYKPKKP